MDIKPITCICQQCKCIYECEYYAETILPVIKTVADNLGNVSDTFIRKLDEALEGFTCEYKE